MTASLINERVKGIIETAATLNIERKTLKTTVKHYLKEQCLFRLVIIEYKRVSK